MQDKKNKFQKRMTLEDKQKILQLYSQGMSNIDISKEINCSNTAVRVFLKKNGLKSNIIKVDRSRPCKVCGKIFTPKCYDGKDKNKYTNCSPECGKIALIQSKTKYTEEDINKVKKLKKQFKTNKEIAKITGIDVNKIKEIIKKNDLKLTPKQAQANAYKAKLKENPNCMEKMRDTRMGCPTNKFNQKIEKIKHTLENPNNNKSIPYLCKKEGLNDNSVRRSMHLRGWENLIGAQSSSAEYEIIDFIKKCLPNIKIEHGNRTILKPKEIDIYMSSLNLAIEYCGLYWHNENSPQPRLMDYHYNKMKQLNKKGIRLITIFEDEWRDRQPQVKNFLRSVLNIVDNRIYARKCEIKQVDKEEAKNFLEKYHIQGKAPFKIAIGLYYENELVGLITGNQHHRHKESNSLFVLNRLVFKDGHLIIGGSSKLLKHLMKWSKECGYEALISWSDNRWSEGDVYVKCNFMLEEELKPDYSYVYANERLSKQSNKKELLLKKGAIGTMQNTEKELAKSLGYYRIWDCGKKRWIISL